MISKAALAKALKGRTAYATVMATDGFEVRISHADAEALREYAGGNIAWWVGADGSMSIEAHATERYGATGDMTDR